MMVMTTPSGTETTVPGFVTDWFAALAPLPLAEAVGDPLTTAVFSTDMINGFCHEGNLASPRVGALAAPVADLFRRAHALDVPHFLLLQDTHDPETPEFGAWPVHCVRGSREAETIPELAGLPFADQFTIIEKNSLHPGVETAFDPWLDRHPELRTGIVAGNCTDLCVYQMAMHLRLRANAGNVAGFRVLVAAETVDTYDLPTAAAAETGALPHPGDFFHQVFLYHLALNGVEVVRSMP